MHQDATAGQDRLNRRDGAVGFRRDLVGDVVVRPVAVVGVGDEPQTVVKQQRLHAGFDHVKLLLRHHVRDGGNHFQSLSFLRRRGRRKGGVELARPVAACVGGVEGDGLDRVVAQDEARRKGRECRLEAGAWSTRQHDRLPHVVPLLAAFGGDRQVAQDVVVGGAEHPESVDVGLGVGGELRRTADTVGDGRERAALLIVVEAEGPPKTVVLLRRGETDFGRQVCIRRVDTDRRGVVFRCTRHLAVVRIGNEQVVGADRTLVLDPVVLVAGNVAAERVAVAEVVGEVQVVLVGAPRQTEPVDDARADGVLQHAVGRIDVIDQVLVGR